MTSNTIQVNISHLTVPLTEFDSLYASGIVSTDLNLLQNTLEKMTQLQEKINTGIKIARPSITRFFNWGTVAQEKTADPQALTQEIQSKLSEMLQHFSEVSKNPSSSSMTLIPPNTSTKSSNDVKDIATGFGNLGANCWANSLLSMVLVVPSFKQAYETVARYYVNDVNYLNQLYGTYLLNALSEYNHALSLKQPVPAQVTQNVRLAFNRFFGSISSTGHELFSKNFFAHEDAYEAMQMLMGRYEEILKSTQQFNPPPTLYCPLETKRFYHPEGELKNADPEKLNRDAYSKLRADDCSVSTSLDYQILIDLQNKGHLSFPALIASFFRSSMQGSEPATYLRNDGKIQNYILTGETRQFSRVPDELLLTIKRFGATPDGQGYKISTPVSVNRTIVLPKEATSNGAPIAYILDAFIVHRGGFGAGHYICYKKINNQWVEADDGSVRYVSESEIDQILRGEKGVLFTSYLHHYSRISQSQQAQAIASLENTVVQPTISDLDEFDITKFGQEKQTYEHTIQILEQLASVLQNNADLSEAFKTLDSSFPHVIGTLRHAIWLHDKTPDIRDYGTTTLNANPKRLLNVQLPWLYASSDKTLLGQMLAIQKKKLAIATEKLYEAHLNAFLTKLNTSSVSNGELLKDLKEKLPESLQWKLHELVYKSHCIKYGKEAVDKREYGRTTLENGDIRKTLKEATESVLNLQGANIVEQLCSFHHMTAEKLQFSYEKEQLQAFHNLLTQTSEILTNQQLAKAFERLDIRLQLKEKLFWHIWYASNMPNVAHFGTKTFYDNPRCLLLIKDNHLASPPICPEKTDPLTQLIALLDRDSK